ncbi:outer membrane protein [Legionella fairfieldensis]|uniref:outer membrane protein n=1 Tax=Legionella fairfieldensis TaxID=45064 RepID=UPI000A6E7AE5|nr:porin family protein [Legionella fairfieldensis]
MDGHTIKSLKVITFLIAGLSASVASSGTMGEAPVSRSNYIATISAGPVWQRGGQTQTFYLTPEIEKTYAANKSTKALGEGEFFLGLQSPLYASFLGQLGVAAGATSNPRLRGEIWDDADPVFNNYIYSYRVQHTYVVLKGKLLADAGYMLTPWISGSVGVGFNRASSFSNTPTIFEALPNPDFSSHTKTSFTYAVGAGVQTSVSNNLQVGIGYEFADWGRSQLGRAAEQTLNSGLRLNHLYTHGFLFNLTYLV